MPKAGPIVGTLNRDTMRPELYGVQGWLAFLCVLLFLGVFLGVVRIAGVLMSESVDSVDTAIDLAFDTAYAGFAAYAGLGLVRVWRNALRVAKAYFFVNFASNLLDCVSLFIDGNSTGTKLGISSSILAGAWLAYLYLSDRVQNTYSRPNAEAISNEFR